MTAAKVMDTIARLPDCDGQAADAVSAHTQVKLEDTLLWKRQFEEVSLKLGSEKVTNWDCLFVHRKQGLFISVYADDIKNGWKEEKTWFPCVEELDEKR